MEPIGLEGIFDLKSWDKGISDYLKGVGKAEKETDGLAKKLGKAYDDMGKSVLNAGKIMGTAVVGGAVAATAAVGAFVASGIGQAKDLESQLGGIAAVLGKTKDEVAPLKELIFDLGIDPTLKVNAQEAADAIELLARNGLSMDQIMGGAAKSTVLLANATGADFGTAADISTDAMSIFKIKAEDMMDAVNGITSVTTASKFSINDYRLALAQGGGVASAAGVEFDDFNTTIAAISPLFASGSDAATSLKTMILRLVPTTSAAEAAMGDLGLTTYNSQAAIDYLNSQGITPVSDKMGDLVQQVYKTFLATNKIEGSAEEAGEKFQKWAIETGVVQSAFYDANGQMREMDEISTLLNDSLAGLSEQEKTKALNTIFGTDAMRAAVGIAESGEVAYTDQALAAKELGVSFDSLTGAMEGGLTKFEVLQIKMGQTDAAESAKTRMDNFAGALEILQGIIDTVSLRIGFAFLPMLTAIARNISDLVDKHADAIVGFFENMAKGIEALVSGADWRTVFPVWLTTTIDLVAQNMDILAGALGGIAVLLASAGIAAAFTAIGAAMAVVVSPLGLLVIGAAALGAAWNTNFLGIKDATLAVLAPVWSAFSAFTNLVTMIADAGAFAVETREALSLFPAALQPIAGWALAAWGALSNFVAIVQDAGFYSVEAKEAVGLLSSTFSDIITGIGEQLPVWKGALLEWGTAAWQWIVDASIVVGAKLAEWSMAVVATLAANLPWLLATMLSWSATLVDWIGLAIAGAITKLGEWATALVAWLTGDGATQLGTGTGGLVSALINWIANDLIPKVAPEMGKFLLALGGAILNIAGALGIAAQSIGSAIWNGIMATDWKAAGSGILTLIQSGWELAKATVLPAIGAVATSLKDKFNDIDWKAVGSSALTLIKDGWEFAKSIVLPAIGAIATSLKTKFNETDWKAVGTDTATAIKDGLKAAAELANGLLASAETIATDLAAKFTATDWDATGSDMMNSLRDGMTTAAAAAEGVTVAALDIAIGLMEGFTGQDWNTSGQDIMNQMRDGIKAAANLGLGLLEEAGDIATSLGEKFSGQPWQAIGTAISTLIKIGLDTASSAGLGLLETAGTIATSVSTKFSEIDWTTLGNDIIDYIKKGIETATGSFYEYVKGIPKAIVKIFTDAATSWTGIGGDIVAGIKKGFDDAWKGMVDAVKNAADVLPDFVKDALGISSPSKVFAEIGRNIVRGLIVGIESQIGALKDTVTDLFSAMAPNEFLSLNLSPTTAFTDRLAGLVDPLREALTDTTSQRETLFGEILNLQQLREAARVAQDFNRANEIFYELQTAYANYNNLTQEQIRLQAQLAQIGGQNDLDRIAFNNEQISFLTDQIALMTQAASMGVNLGGFAVGDTGLDNLRKMVALEERISTAKLAQLMNQAVLMKKQVEFNRIVGDKFLNATAKGSWAERFRAQVVEPFMRILDVDATRGSAQQLVNLSESQQRVDLLREQINLLKDAADQGLNLDTLFPNSLIGNAHAASQMLSIVQQISTASEQSLRNEILLMKEAQKREAGLTAAMKQLQPIIDQTNVSSVFGQRYKATVLDPILKALEEAAGIDSERVRLMAQYTQAAQKLAEIQKKEDQLDFLQQQLDIVTMIRDQDIPGGDSLFAGLTFGLNASIDDLTALTSRTLDGLIKQVKAQLGIASPSKVFAEIGGQMMAGLAQGIQTSVMGPINALRQSTVAQGAMSTRTMHMNMGGVTINTPMDEVMFERRVQRVMERAFA